jgi:hypothetical protein
MKKTWSQKSCGTAPLNFLLHVQHCTKWKHQILAVIPCQLETISHSHDCESTKRSPPHTHTLKWRKYILRGEGRILRTIPRKCSPLAQIRREQKKPGPLLLVYFMGPAYGATNGFCLRPTRTYMCSALANWAGGVLAAAARSWPRRRRRHVHTWRIWHVQKLSWQYQWCPSNQFRWRHRRVLLRHST